MTMLYVEVLTFRWRWLGGKGSCRPLGMKTSRLLVGPNGVDISMFVLRMSIGTVKSVKTL